MSNKKVAKVDDKKVESFKSIDMTREQKRKFKNPNRITMPRSSMYDYEG